MKSTRKSISLLFLLVFIIGPYAYGQKRISAMNKFQYEKSHDGSRRLSARLFVKSPFGLKGVNDTEFTFAAETDSANIELGTATTDEDGWGYLIIDKGYPLPHVNGKTTFVLTCSCNDSIKRLSDDMDIIDVNLAMKTEKDGDIKKVTLRVSDLQRQPVEKTKVKLYVKRLYSLMPLGDARTDTLGMAVFEVPGNIPGDAEGKITLVGLIERDRKFGNVEVRQDVNWGVPNTYSVSEERKNLWTQSAPIWMQVAVFGVFITIAFFFFFSLYQVFIIPKDQ